MCYSLTFFYVPFLLTDYKDYTEKIRMEYNFVPDAMYSRLRSRVLSSFLQIPNIFATEPFRRKYEERAKSNIKAEIVELNAASASPTQWAPPSAAWHWWHRCMSYDLRLLETDQQSVFMVERVSCEIYTSPEKAHWPLCLVFGNISLWFLQLANIKKRRLNGAEYKNVVGRKGNLIAHLTRAMHVVIYSAAAVARARLGMCKVKGLHSFKTC